MDNKELRQIIIQTYITAKSLKDSFLCNNNLIEEYEDNFEKLNLVEKEDPKFLYYSKKYKLRYENLMTYTDSLFILHQKLKESTNELINAIDKELSCISKKSVINKACFLALIIFIFILLLNLLIYFYLNKYGF